MLTHGVLVSVLVGDEKPERGRGSRVVESHAVVITIVRKDGQALLGLIHGDSQVLHDRDRQGSRCGDVPDLLAVHLGLLEETCDIRGIDIAI